MRKRIAIGFLAVLAVILVWGGLISWNMRKLQTVNEARYVTHQTYHLMEELDRVSTGTIRVLDEILWDDQRLDEIKDNLRRMATLIGRLDEVVLSDSLAEKGCGVCHEEPGKLVRNLLEIMGEFKGTSRELKALSGLLEASPSKMELYPLIIRITGTIDLAQEQISRLQAVILPMFSHTEKHVDVSILHIRKTHNLIGILGALIVLGVTLIMSFAVTWPVRQLTKGTEAIARGDFSYRIHMRGRNEAAVLAERFNTMAQVLASREQSLLQQKVELEALNETLEKKVRERTRELEENKDELKRKYQELEQVNARTRSSFLQLQSTADELEQARTKLQDNYNVLKVMNEELKRAGEVKNKFLSIMSHELRTPLTVINGYLSLVLEKDFGRPGKELRDILGVVKEQSRNQLGLIEELLDLTRIESGEFKLQRDTFSLKDLLSKAVENFRPRLEEKEIRTDLWVDSSIPPVYWDFQKILQVLQNLLDNATKFTPNGGEIGISAQFKNAFIEISVRDSGIGIPKDQIQHVFERFYQADSSSTRQYGGSGLGLSIVHEIILAHQGKIFVESDEGKGTCFLILLPVGDGARARESREEKSIAFEDSWRGEARGHGEKILVVDDDEAFLKMMEMVLPREGYGVNISSDPRRTLGLARRFGSDLIILDLMMPHVDGFEVCRRIRRDKILADKPILVVSAAGGLEVEQKVMDAGADGHIIKPFDQGVLLAQIGRLLKTGRKGPAGSERKTDSAGNDG